MQGRMKIDDTDAFTAYGVYLQDGSGKALVQMPPLKAVAYNDWAEYDGVEADLDLPVLDSRQIQLSFHIRNIASADAFLAMLKSAVYHDFYFPRLAKTYRLRLVSNGNLSLYLLHGIPTLTFAEDEIIRRSVTPSTSNVVESDGYRLDNIDLARFGCRVTEGTEANVRRWADIRQRLRRNSKYSAGSTYDEGGAVCVKSRDLTLNLHLHTVNIATFWTYWDALFTEMLLPQERTLTAMGYSFGCHYKSNSIKTFRITDNGEVWCDFSVTLTVLNYGTAEEIIVVRVLGTESGAILVDSENRALAINV